MKFMLLVLICTISFGNILSQDALPKRKNVIGGFVGYQSSLLKDDNFSFLNYRGTGLLYGINYTRYFLNSSLTVDVKYGTGDFKTKGIEEFTTDYIYGDFFIQYLSKTSFVKSDTWDLEMGGRYNFFIRYLDWQDLESFTFFANHSLDFSTALTHTFNDKNQFSILLDIPILSFLVRPPYNGFDYELDQNYEQGNAFKLITDGYWGSLNKLLSYDLKLAYNYSLTDRWMLNLSYRNAFYRTNEQHRYIEMYHQFLVKTQFKF